LPGGGATTVPVYGYVELGRPLRATFVNTEVIWKFVIDTVMDAGGVIAKPAEPGVTTSDTLVVLRPFNIGVAPFGGLGFP